MVPHDPDRWVEFLSTFSRAHSPWAADILLAKEYAPCKVVHLYAIEIKDMDLTDAQQCQVLDDLVANSPE